MGRGPDAPAPPVPWRGPFPQTRYTTAAPLGRLGTAADVAAACLFLAHPAAAFITGIDLTVDGGVSVHPHW